MSLDLTGGLIVSFLLDELAPVLARHPRFRDNDGRAFQVFSNLIQFRDVSATIGNLRGDSNRISPDYFLGTAWARALLAQVDGHPGGFIDWLQEIDPTRQTPAPGMYLLAVDQVDEAAQQVRFITTRVRTCTGSVRNADGTVIGVDPGIPLALVQPSDPQVSVTKAGTKLWLNRYTPSLDLLRSDTGAVLRPGVDWWLERTTTLPLGTTVGGAQFLLRPDGLADLAVLDPQGQALRHGLDWSFTGDGRIRLAPATPAGQVYSARGLMRLDPAVTPLIHPENRLALAPLEGELPAQALSYHTPSGNYGIDDTVLDSDGNRVLLELLTPGDDLWWEAHLTAQQSYLSARKGAMTAELIPGLNLAISRTVEPGDQLGILVHPEPAEAYRIHGGKDTLSFDLTLKSNDLATSSELAMLVRSYLLVQGRDRMESAGITVFSVGYGYGGEQRDASGTAVSHPVVLNVTLAADWETYDPVLSSIAWIDLDLEVSEATPRSLFKAADRTPFITSYF